MSRTWIFDMTDLDAPALIGTYVGQVYSGTNSRLI